MNSPKKQCYYLQSLAKGLAALQAFAEAGLPLTLSELAQAVGTTNTTATRLCYTLSELGYIQRNGQRQYQLTPNVLSLGYSVICGLEWREVARYYLERLFEVVQETVSLSMLEGQDVFYTIRIRKRKYLSFDISVGTKLPVHCTAMGKVLMAMGTPEQTQPILERLDFRPLTAHTVTRLDDFLEELNTVRSKGYAINDEELSIGNRAVAAPVFDGNGFAFAAINVAVPTAEYSRRDMEETLAPLVMRSAEEISKALLAMEAP